MKYFIFLLFSIISSGFFIQAQAANDIETRENCLEILKVNVEEAGLSVDAVDGLKGLNYKVLEGDFSKYYKNLSSFGVDLESAKFDARIYSFGAQTGYIHPPLSPYPSSTKADVWDSPAKEHIIMEEYIRDANENRHFLGCAYFQVQSPDLMSVTRDRYVYDGELMSAIKVEGDYKAWYNENYSFDGEGVHFVTWKRLFVYPKATENEFFSRYGVLEAFPSNKVNSFTELYPVLEPDSDEAESDIVHYVAYGENGIIKSMSSDALRPVRLPENELFPFNSYYRAIEAQYPEMIDNLSVRGLTSYNQIKKLIASRKDTEKNSVWSVIVDTRDATNYYQKKERGDLEEESKVFENFIDRIDQIDLEIKELVGDADTVLSSENEDVVVDSEESMDGNSDAKNDLEEGGNESNDDEVSEDEVVGGSEVNNKRKLRESTTGEDGSDSETKTLGKSVLKQDNGRVNWKFILIGVLVIVGFGLIAGRGRK